MSSSGSKPVGRSNTIFVNQIADGDSKPMTCAEQFLSVKILLPTTVAIIVCVMATVTISLLALNTDRAVNGVVDLLHDQVQALVESRILAHLDQVLTINMASARALAKRPLGAPPGNQTPVNDPGLAAHLDSVVSNYPLIDVHYVFHTNGRVVGVLANDNTTQLYAEEFYPDGLYFWAYETGNISTIPTNRSNTALHIPDYVGYTRPYFTTQDHAVPFDYSWTNPYKVGPLLLFTNTITMIDSAGNFQGVMGADSYITTLTTFFTTLRPTEKTKVFLADPTGLLVITTHGDVLTENGDRIACVDSNDQSVAEASRQMGDFAVIPTITSRKEIKENGKTWLLSYRRIEILRASLVVGVITPEEEFLGSSRRTTRETIGICVAIATIGLGVIIALCVAISRSLGKLEQNLDRVARLEIDYGDSSPDAADFAEEPTQRKPQGVFSEIQRTNESYVKLRTAIGAFRRYVPVSVVHGLLKGSILPHTNMRPCKVAVSFQDIVGFTSLCERYEPTLVVKYVSELFEEMSAIIQKNHGTIDKYIGDAIMSFWEVSAEDTIVPVTSGAWSPREKNYDVENDCKSDTPTPASPQSPSAIEKLETSRLGNSSATEACENCLASLQESYSACLESLDGMAISFRSGAHFGDALIGNFGSSTRFSYTVVGDTVNSAARLEPFNKETKTTVLVSGELASNVSDSKLRSHLLAMGKVMLVGKAGKTPLYAVTKESVAVDLRTVWERGMDQFEAGDFAAARATFSESIISGELATAAAEMKAVADDCLCNPPIGDMIGCRLQRTK